MRVFPSSSRARMQAPLSVQILSPDGRTVQVNAAWERLWGVTLDALRDHNLLEDPQLVAKGLMPFHAAATQQQ